jgi:hypothetical protein
MLELDRPRLLLDYVWKSAIDSLARDTDHSLLRKPIERDPERATLPAELAGRQTHQGRRRETGDSKPVTGQARQLQGPGAALSLIHRFPPLRAFSQWRFNLCLADALCRRLEPALSITSYTA